MKQLYRLVSLKYRSRSIVFLAEDKKNGITDWFSNFNIISNVMLNLKKMKLKL